MNLQDGSADSGADAGSSCAKETFALASWHGRFYGRCSVCLPGLLMPPHLLVGALISSPGAFGRFSALEVLKAAMEFM